MGSNTGKNSRLRTDRRGFNPCFNGSWVQIVLPLQRDKTGRQFQSLF
ncbi:hypothetical protein MCHI_000477 [Candidatus Magnetoovum chiemensis]|nr:hypothetical protein MCHI_000477 [Candidatus Magnetoovum chiemensis]